MSTGLLQLPAVRSDRQTHAASIQSVQNTGAKRREHITQILRQLHWLPVRRRVEFKDFQLGIPSAVKQSTYLSG